MGKVILGACLGVGFLMILGMVVSSNKTKPTIGQTSAESSGVAERENAESVAASEQRPVPVPAINVNAIKLWMDYQANEVAADNSYKGRQLLVTGQITGIKKDFWDRTFLALAAPNEFEDVHADLRSEFVPEAATLHMGQMIRVQCEGGGMVVGSPVLRECSIVHEVEQPVSSSTMPQTEPAQATVSNASVNKPAYIPSTKVAALMKREETLNDKCRGGSGDDPATQQACVGREELLDAIKAQGWCWGHDGQAGYQKDWSTVGNPRRRNRRVAHILCFHLHTTVRRAPSIPRTLRDEWEPQKPAPPPPSLSCGRPGINPRPTKSARTAIDSAIA